MGLGKLEQLMINWETWADRRVERKVVRQAGKEMMDKPGGEETRQEGKEGKQESTHKEKKNKILNPKSKSQDHNSSKQFI